VQGARALGAAVGVRAVGLALVVALAPTASCAAPAAEPVHFAQVQAVVQQRCVLCHNAQLAQKGVALHTPELLQQARPGGVPAGGC
jgi:uncharacterized membrane protein